MRVGILTLPPLSNYGGILQAYALQTILQRMGHEACIIVYKRRYHASFPMWKVPFVYGKRIYMKIVGKYCLPIFYEREYNRVMNCPGEDTKLFVKKYLKCRFIADFSNIKQTDYDAIIVGSDQVWRPKYFVEPIEMAYLGFAEKWSRQIKRISYAASFGTDAWEYNRNDSIKCKKLAAAFDAVSVRENSGKHLCHEHFGIDAEVMPDPTLLLSRADYIGLFREALIPKSSGTLLTYILDETKVKMQIIKRVAEEKNIVPFSVNSNYHHATRLSSDPPPHTHVRCHTPAESLERWLRGFYDADFVITDSFHGCVFSILFNKPFIVIGNYHRGMSRFHSLLNQFNLRDCLVSEAANEINIPTNWDWENVNRIIEKKTSEAVGFLKRYIK